MQKLQVVKLGIAFGVAWALLLLFGGLTSALLNWGVELTNVLSSIYIGYGPSISGSLIGAAWGLLNGFLWGVVIGWVYNKIG